MNAAPEPLPEIPDLDQGLAFFWRKNYRAPGRETNPLVQRFVSNRTKALYYEHQGLGNYFTYRHAIPILGIDPKTIFRDGKLLLPEGYVDFGYMWSQAGPPQSALDAIRAHVDEETLAPYPPDLFSPLRDLAAQKKFRCPRSERFDVLGTEGAQGAIGYTFLAHLDPGDEVIVTDPSYMHFGAGPKIEGAVITAIPMRPGNGFRLDPDEVKAKITNRTKMLVLCDPLNPFGTVQTKEELAAISELCRRNGILIFNNITHNTHRTDPGAEQFPLHALHGELQLDHVVACTGISKGYALAGMRIGFLGGHPDVLKGAAMLRMEVTKIHINPLAQYAALAALADDAYVEQATAIVRRNLGIIKKAVAASDGVQLAVEPRYGFCLCLDVSGTGVTAQELTVALFRQGFCVIPGDATGDVGATSLVRMNYSQRDPAGLERFAAQLGDAVRDAQRGAYAEGVKAFFRKVDTARGRRIIEEIETRQARTRARASAITGA